MNLVLIAACFAVCQGAKLNRGYLPPESAKTAGGNGDILQTPFKSQELIQDKSLPTRLPVGSYVNEFEGVVIDADSAGTRATHSGLGNPRETYGSTDSKVGEAAFRESILNANKGANKQDGQNVVPNVNTNNANNKQHGQNVAPINVNANNANNKQHGHLVLPNVAGVRQPLLQPGHQIPVLEAERFHASRDRASNIITYQNDIGITDFNYAFQTDNGISAAEIGMALDGVKSKGGYSYTGDDGQVYTISYTADEAGYRPQGSHIPTPPPIPAEIQKALEQNAKDEAAGIVDDGSYDAKKYNTDRTKGNKPNDKHNTFERRPAFNVISTINQNSQTNKPHRDEDNRSNGQNQFPNVNPGYTVNDKLISNFTNIRNQYENGLGILTNNKFNNNGPISNFKDLDDVMSDGKNQSQNVPLSQQKLQDKIEVPNSNGRPNSYQAPIAAIQNQQQNNQDAFQKQSQIQFRPNTFQSINGANNKQQGLNKQNSFVSSNNFQSRPNSYQTQTSGLGQGHQNFNKKGAIFQTHFQNNFNANQQNQQSFSSGITSTQFNTNSQKANKPNSNIPNPTFNNQANAFTKQTITQTKPSSYDASTASINQNQKPVTNVGNSFTNTIQSRPTSYDAPITGAIQNQNPTANFNDAFSGQIATQKIPISSNGPTIATFQKQQSIVNSGNIFSNPTSQSRPASYDASITGNIQNEQSVANSGNIFSTPTLTQAKPQASFSGVIQNQQQIGNFGNVFPRPTQAQARPGSYDLSITGNNIQTQQSITNSGNFFSTPISTRAKPNLQASTSEAIQSQQQNGNFGNILSSPAQTQAKPTSFEASITGNIQNQQLIANSGNILSTPNLTHESISETIEQQQNGNSGNVFSRPTQTQARPTSYEASNTGNIQQQQSIANSGTIFSTLNQNQANSHSPSGGTIQQQQQNGNFGNFFSRPTQTQARPTSYDSSISGTYYQKQQVTNTNNAFSKPTTIQPGPTLTSSNEELATTDNSSPQQDTVQGNPGSQFSNFANSGQSLDGQYEGELYEYPKPDTNLASVSPVTANTQKPSISKPTTSQPRPNSYDASFTGAIQQKQQYFINLPNVDQYENKNNKQNGITNNQGVTSAQFVDVNSQHAILDNNGAYNGNTGRPSFNNQNNIFSKHTPERTNSQTTSGETKQQQSNHVQNANKFQDNLNTNQQNQGTFTSGVTSIQFSNSNSPQTNIDINSASGNFERPANSQINIFNNQVKTEDSTTEEGIQHQQPHSISDITNQFQNKESGNQQNNEGVTSTQYNIQDTTVNNNNLQLSDSLSQFSSNVPASPNFGSSFARPSQNFGSHQTSPSNTFNGPTSNDNGYKNNIGLVAISSTNSGNDDFGSNFLHKKFSIRKQQELNQQGFSNFLQSNNVANAPVVISSNYNNQYSTAQPSFGFSNLNSGSNAYQGSPLQLLSSSQLNQPNPTPQTFSVTGSDKLYTAAPSRVLSTPKDTITVSQGTSGITQASISPFPSLAPFSKDSGNSNSVSQTGSLSSQAIGSSLGVNLVPSHSQQANLGLILGFGNTGSSVNTQNQGEVYEYPKPEPNLPNPTKASEDSDQTNSSPSTVNSNSQIQLNNPLPTISSEIEQNTKTESGPKLLPSRPNNIISSSCCFSSQNTGNQNNDSTGVNSDSNTSTFHNGKEEFEGPKSPQTYDETGYHY